MPNEFVTPCINEDYLTLTCLTFYRDLPEWELTVEKWTQGPISELCLLHYIRLQSHNY